MSLGSCGFKSPYGQNTKPTTKSLFRTSLAYAISSNLSQIWAAPWRRARIDAQLHHAPTRWFYSRRFMVVVPQHPTESFATADVTASATDFITRLDQLVVQPLMIPLLMIMKEEHFDSPP